MRIKRILGYSVTFIGILIALAAIGAGILGVERDAGWGPARLFSLAVGLALVTLANLGDLIRRFTRHSHLRPDEEQGGKTAKSGTPIGSLTSIESSSFQTPFRDRTLTLSLLVIFCISVTTLTWLISYGRWKPWPETTNYYHLLGEGFRAGETHLLVEPDSRLLDIENPYEIANRGEVQYLWDVSLFDGKYYLYWGPAPGIIVLVVEAITHSSVGDHQLVWFFSVLTVLFMMLILRMFWQEVFPELSAASVVPVALAAASINPLMWLVSRPAVYEAAVAGGQAFFIGGVLCLAPLLWRHRVHRGRIALGSTFWVFAVGSRISLVFAVLLLPLGLALFILLSTPREGGSWRRFLPELGSLLGPLILGAMVLAWYNFDRFGSIFEFGQRYQLGQLNMRDTFNLVVNLRNVPMNLYNYFLNPPGWLKVFPYLKPAWGGYAIPFLRYTAPETYYTEKVTGILIASPVVLIGLLPVAGWLRAIWHNIDLEADKRLPTHNPFINAPFGYLYTGLIIGVFLLSLPMLAVSFLSMRHEFDIVPMLSLCAVLGYAFAWQRTSARSRQHRFLVMMTWLAIVWTIATSLLLSLTGYASNFEKMNFELFDKLTKLLTW